MNMTFTIRSIFRDSSKGVICEKFYCTLLHYYPRLHTVMVYYPEPHLVQRVIPYDGTIAFTCCITQFVQTYTVVSIIDLLDLHLTPDIYYKLTRHINEQAAYLYIYKQRGHINRSHLGAHREKSVTSLGA